MERPKQIIGISREWSFLKTTVLVLALLTGVITLLVGPPSVCVAKEVPCPSCGGSTPVLYLCTKLGCKNSKKSGCLKCNYDQEYHGVRCVECKSIAKLVWESKD